MNFVFNVRSGYKMHPRPRRGIDIIFFFKINIETAEFAGDGEFWRGGGGGGCGGVREWWGV